MSIGHTWTDYFGLNVIFVSRKFLGVSMSTGVPSGGERLFKAGWLGRVTLNELFFYLITIKQRKNKQYAEIDQPFHLPHPLPSFHCVNTNRFLVSKLGAMPRPNHT